MTSVADVLSCAADLLERRGWVPERTYRSSDRRMTALQAITAAVDELASTGPESADLHEAALDAVCLHVFGQRHGTAKVSVSQWERRPNRPAGMLGGRVIPAQSALTAEEVIRTLRAIAQNGSGSEISRGISAADGLAAPAPADPANNRPTTNSDAECESSGGSL